MDEVSETTEKYVPIESIDDLNTFAGRDVTIFRMFDTEINMTTIRVEHMIAMSGNLGDFYPGCHGGWHYDLAKETFGYRSSGGFAEALQKALLTRGAKSVKIEHQDYDWYEYTASDAYRNI